jgi:hypothetical protein
MVSECAVDTRYLGPQSVEGLREFLVQQIKGTKQRFVIEHLFHLQEKNPRSTRLIRDVQQLLGSLVGFYRYVVGIVK